MESDEKKEKQVRTLKKNLKLLMIALIVLAIEKLSEFITALFSGSMGTPASNQVRNNIENIHHVKLLFRFLTIVFAIFHQIL